MSDKAVLRRMYDVRENRQILLGNLVLGQDADSQDGPVIVEHLSVLLL